MYTDCEDQDVDVSGATIQPPIPAEPRGSAWALPGAHVADIPGPCPLLLSSSYLDGDVQLATPSLFSLCMLFLRTPSPVEGVPADPGRCQGRSPLSLACAPRCSRSRACCCVLSDAWTRVDLDAGLLPGHLWEAQ